MFTKYLGKFKKAEAEWVMEVLDMHGGVVDAAVEAIKASLERLAKRAEPVAELKDFDDTILGCFFASRDWWSIGIERLAQLELLLQTDGKFTATRSP